MGSIQLALSNTSKAEMLRGVLSRSSQLSVVCVERPDLETACAVVVDQQHFDTLPRPLACPDKVVLIAANDPDSLGLAWDAGVSSVVHDEEPLHTAVLAILAVCLRSGTARPKDGLQII